MSISGDINPLTITLEDAVELIRNKHEAESKKVLKSFAEDPDLEILNGRYGAYISYQGSNYKISRSMEPSALYS